MNKPLVSKARLNKTLLAVSFLTMLAGADVAQAQMAMPVLPPAEIVASVHSLGLAPISRPHWQGRVYVLRAVDERGHEHRVLVDARSGEVIEAVPVVRAANYPALRDDLPPQAVQPMPPRVIPAPRSTLKDSARPPLPKPKPSATASAAPASPPPAAPPRDTMAKTPELKASEQKAPEQKASEEKPAISVPPVQTFE